MALAAVITCALVLFMIVFVLWKACQYYMEAVSTSPSYFQTVLVSCRYYEHCLHRNRNLVSFASGRGAAVYLTEYSKTDASSQ